MRNFKIQILSVPHRERLIAEIQYNHYIVAEISNDNNKLKIEVFSYNDNPMLFLFDEFIEILNEAKDKLVNF